MEPSSEMREGDLERGNSFRLQSRGHSCNLKLNGLRRIRGELVLAFADCRSIEAAYRLVGHEVWTDKALEPGTDTERSPLGFAVVDTGGGDCGVVTAVHRRQLNPMLELTFSGRRILVPWHRDIVIRIDEEAQRVVISPPPGLMDLNS